MKWKKFTLTTTTEAVDLISSMLNDIGIQGVEIEDNVPLTEQETKGMFIDILPELPPDDGVAKVSFYVDDSEPEEEVLKKVKEGLDEMASWTDLGARTITESETEDKDWINNWKQYFKPFPVGERFLIKPSWETVEDAQGRQILEIDPASSFGTGTHDTTQLCISMLEKTVKGGEKLLDMGTGSGILAIAAGMLGANPDTAVDIDAHCLTCAQENAERNGVTIGRTLHGDALRDQKLAQQIGGGYQIICANIVADIIIGMAPMFYEKLVPGGTLITSGILEERADEVGQALERAGFTLCDRAVSGGWAAFTARR